MKKTYKNCVLLMILIKTKGYPLEVITRKGQKSTIRYFGDIVSDYLNVEKGITFFQDQ